MQKKATLPAESCKMKIVIFKIGGDKPTIQASFYCIISYILFFRVLLYICEHMYVQIVEKKLCYTDDYTLLLKFGVVCILKLLSCKILSI